MTDKISFDINLEDKPSQVYPIWLKQISTRAASLCADLYPYGLLFLVIPQALYITFPKCFTAAGEPIPYPNPTRPDQPGAGAAAGTVAIYKENFDNWQRFMLNSAALREGIIKSLGIDIERTQTDAITGICVHNTNTIMANIAQLYGIVTSADLVLLRAELALPLIGTDHTTFSAHGAQFQEKVAILQRSGHPLAQWD